MSDLQSANTHVEESISTVKHQLLNFHPAWFISVMGTGITTSILYNFPYEAFWLRCVAYVMFFICTCLLIISTVLFIGKVWVDNERINIMSSMKISVFLGCYAMGFMSWCNDLFFISRHGSPTLALTLWWINVAFGLFTSWVVLFCIVRNTNLQSYEITTTLLLPVVTLTVCASAGQIIHDSLPHHLQLINLIVCFVLWANAIVLSFILLTIFFYRMLRYGLPSQSTIFTMFIPIGFMGQGAFAIELLGINLHNYLLSRNQDDTIVLIEALIFKNIGLLVGLFLQSVGYTFTFYAACGALSSGFQRYQHGFWATTFPLGTMSLAALQTYHLTDWTSFRTIAVIYAMGLFAMTLTCLIGSGIIVLKGIITKKNQRHRDSAKDSMV